MIFFVTVRAPRERSTLLLVNLLRQAGIAADPLLIRTADRGLPEKMFPVKGQFNHVIAVAEIDGTQILLDAVSGSADLNKLHKLDIGTRGMGSPGRKSGLIEIFSPRNRQLKKKGHSLTYRDE